VGCSCQGTVKTGGGSLLAQEIGKRARNISWNELKSSGLEADDLLKAELDQG